MRLPVDSSVTHFVPVGPSEPVFDFDTKKPKVDRRTPGGGARMPPVLTLRGGAQAPSPPQYADKVTGAHCILGSRAPPVQTGPSTRRGAGGMKRNRERLLLSLEEAALVLGIGRSTLYRAVKGGRRAVPGAPHRWALIRSEGGAPAVLGGRTGGCGPGNGVGVSGRTYTSERSSRRRPMCAAARWSSLEIGSV